MLLMVAELLMIWQYVRCVLPAHEPRLPLEGACSPGHDADEPLRVRPQSGRPGVARLERQAQQGARLHSGVHAAADALHRELVAGAVGAVGDT